MQGVSSYGFPSGDGFPFTNAAFFVSCFRKSRLRARGDSLGFPSFRRRIGGFVLFTRRKSRMCDHGLTGSSLANRESRVGYVRKNGPFSGSGDCRVDVRSAIFQSRQRVYLFRVSMKFKARECILPVCPKIRGTFGLHIPLHMIRVIQERGLTCWSSWQRRRSRILTRCPSRTRDDGCQAF